MNIQTGVIKFEMKTKNQTTNMFFLAIWLNSFKSHLITTKENYKHWLHLNWYTV